MPQVIVDAHLDLAYNAVRGRAVTRPAAEQQADHEGIPTVGLPDLRAGGVGLVCATIFCEPSPGVGKPGYRTADEARAAALRQLAWYQQQESAGRMRFVTSAGEVREDVDRGWKMVDGGQHSSPSTIHDAPSTPSAPLAAILLLEGADPLRSPADLADWFNAGLRIVGLAWRRTRLAGGTGAPGPLTAEGVELVRAMDAFGIIHDTSHLAEESFWQLLDRTGGPVMASHSNCRAIVPTDRQLSDEMIKALVARGGVVGINFFDKFLLEPKEHGKRRATLADVARHARHISDLAGSARHVAIGTDMDGGLGRDEIPEEIVTSADLPKVADALSAAGFNDADVRGIMGGNWLRFFRAHLAPANPPAG